MCGVSLGRIPSIKVKGLPDVDCSRMPHILLDIVFPIDSIPLAQIDICTNENLCYLEYANASFISSFLL